MLEKTVQWRFSINSIDSLVSLDFSSIKFLAFKQFFIPNVSWKKVSLLFEFFRQNGSSCSNVYLIILDLTSFDLKIAVHFHNLKFIKSSIEIHFLVDIFDKLMFNLNLHIEETTNLWIITESLNQKLIEKAAYDPTAWK